MRQKRPEGRSQKGKWNQNKKDPEMFKGRNKRKSRKMGRNDGKVRLDQKKEKEQRNECNGKGKEKKRCPGIKGIFSVCLPSLVQISQSGAHSGIILNESSFSFVENAFILEFSCCITKLYLPKPLLIVRTKHSSLSLMISLQCISSVRCELFSRDLASQTLV